MRQERGLSSAASCSGFSDRARKKEDVYLCTGELGRDGLGLPFPHRRTSPPSPGLTATLDDALSDQVPVEIIRDLLTGTRRGNWWPRDHVVCWAIVPC